MTLNKLTIATALVSTLAFGQAQAAYTDGVAADTDYLRYARVVLGIGDRSTTAAPRKAAPGFETYRSVVGGAPFAAATGSKTENRVLSGHAAYQRVVGGRMR